MNIKLIVSLVMLGLAALFVGLSLLKYRKAHWIYATANLSAVVLAIVFGVIIANLTAGALAGLAYNLLESMDVLGDFEELLTKLPSLEDTFRALVACVVAPLLFFFIFLILKAIFRGIAKPVARKLIARYEASAEQKKAVAEPVVVEETAEEAVEAPAETEAETVVSDTAEAEATEAAEAVTEEVAAEPEKPHKPTHKEKKKNKKQMLRTEKANPWGMLGGALCGLLLFVALLAPLVGTINLANNAISVISVVGEEDETMSAVVEIADIAANNAGSKLVTWCGGYPIYAGLTTYRVGDHLVSLNREVKFMAATATAVIEMTDENADPAVVAESFRKAGKFFEKTDLLPVLLPELCHAAFDDWNRGEAFCGIEKPSFGDPVDLFAQPFIDVLADSTYDTIKEDVVTVFDLVAQVAEADALERMEEDPMLLFEDQEFSAGMLCSLLENPRMSGMVGGFVKFGVQTLGETLGMHDGKEDLYDEWMEDMIEATRDTMTATLDDEQMAEALIAAYQKVFDQYGLVLDPSAAAVYANAVLEEYGVDGGYEIRLSTLEKLFEETAVKNAEGEEVYLNVNTMADQTVMVFLSDLNVGGTVTDPEKESRALAKILADVAKIIADGEELSVTNAMPTIGLILDDLVNTELVGKDETAKILRGLFQTEDICEILGCTPVQVTDIVDTIIEEAEKKGYEPLMEAMGHTIDALQNAADADNSPEEKIGIMLENMTPEVARVLNKMALPGMMTANGVPEEYAEASAEMLATVFSKFAEMMDAGLTSEQIREESKALNNVLNLMMNIENINSGKAFGEDGVLGISASDYVAHMMDSRVVGVAMVDIVYPDGTTQPDMDPLGLGNALDAEEQAALAEALDARFEQETDPTNAEVQKTYVAIAAILNVPVTVTANGVQLA